MKTVIIHNGESIQIDLIPETKHDKSVLALIGKGQCFKAGEGMGYEQNKGGYMSPFPTDNMRSFTFIASVDPSEGEVQA